MKDNSIQYSRAVYQDVGLRSARFGCLCLRIKLLDLQTSCNNVGNHSLYINQVTVHVLLYLHIQFSFNPNDTCWVNDQQSRAFNRSALARSLSRQLTLIISYMPRFIFFAIDIRLNKLSTDVCLKGCARPARASVPVRAQSTARFSLISSRTTAVLLYTRCLGPVPWSRIRWLASYVSV